MQRDLRIILIILICALAGLIWLQNTYCIGTPNNTSSENLNSIQHFTVGSTASQNQNQNQNQNQIQQLNIPHTIEKLIFMKNYFISINPNEQCSEIKELIVQLELAE